MKHMLILKRAAVSRLLCLSRYSMVQLSEMIHGRVAMTTTNGTAHMSTSSADNKSDSPKDKESSPKVDATSVSVIAQERDSHCTDKSVDTSSGDGAKPSADEPVRSFHEPQYVSSFSSPNLTLGPLETNRDDFPLAGFIGLSDMISDSHSKRDTEIVPPPNAPYFFNPSSVTNSFCSELYRLSAEDDYVAILRRLSIGKSSVKMENINADIGNISADNEPKNDATMTTSSNVLTKSFPKMSLESVSCNDIMRREFAPLFKSERNILSNDTCTTILVMTQKTKHDMSAWSPPMESEREDLLKSFVTSAKVICEWLMIPKKTAKVVTADDDGESSLSAGDTAEPVIWADFIDPSNGKPFLATNNSADVLYETDDRMRLLGFRIDDVGCCKVLRHLSWGSHVYAGLIFTNLPYDDPRIVELLQNGLI